MNIISVVIQKLKAFRPTIPSALLFLLASYRTLTSGDSIQLVGICAAVVPFICQFKNFHRADSSVPAVQDVLAGYIVNLLYMCIYLSWILLLTWVGKTFLPGYVENPDFKDMLFIAIAADVVFISAVIPVCRELTPFQRMIPGLVLTNGLLFFMMMAASFVKTTSLTNIPMLALGIAGLVMMLTLGMIFAGYREQKK